MNLYVICQPHLHEIIKGYSSFFNIVSGLHTELYRNDQRIFWREAENQLSISDAVLVFKTFDDQFDPKLIAIECTLMGMSVAMGKPLFAVMPNFNTVGHLSSLPTFKRSFLSRNAFDSCLNYLENLNDAD